MTIKQLKAAIADLPDDMDVMLDSNPEEGLYGLAESAIVKKVNWQDEEIPEEEWVTNDCLVISDEM